ncbi:23S rRNA methyltransferase [Devosia epidermidihirudinis]|uniref:Ribosomal RNA large subunit methyltransferase E n=1 Tax=Devosia epidermidihirudinis TaxID=1293439 RepID=A0A0F5QFG5_9HYPH|nr:RlmE family RNA methyltransferase [Devosia epidermidihirudinis]KKC39717.1 23S rRNA methyltransferase [Devosia epidermidihirudinis]
MVDKALGTGGRKSEKDLKIRVKSAKGRKVSSTKWLERQLNDPYVAKARAAGYRSRAAFKIKEMDEKHHLFRKGMRVVDLGAAPGGWSQVAAAATGSTDANPLIVGIDYLEMDPIPGVILLRKDFTDDDAPAQLIAAMGGKKADIVMSDMAWPTTGHRPTDHLRIVQLIEIAAAFALDVLTPGGVFVAKVFQGGTEHELLHMLKRHFKTTFHAKPPSSRADSAEAYLIAKGFKGTNDTEPGEGEYDR